MSAPRRLALLVAYHGAALHGFARQPGFPTVQEELENAWEAATGERLVVQGSGRTDAGVHAHGQVAHLSTWAGLPERKVVPALNAYLDEAIAVRAAAEVAPEFHARESATGKRYVYRLHVGPVRPVLGGGLVAWGRRQRGLDLAAMRAAARLLEGRHDFSAFAAAGRTTKTSARTLRGLRVRPARDGLLLLFEGDGFLYRMVRNLVGTLLEIGRGRRAPEWAAAVLDSRDRRRAGATAPAEGLCLWRVLYPTDPFAAWRRARFAALRGPAPGSIPGEIPSDARW